MLETLVAWVLNNYVGEYFQLNTDQLTIALLQGQVDLENVPLRPTALRKLDIPVQLKCGVIGRLQLQIPLAHIRSQPWILKMSDFLVLLGPCTSMYDVEIIDNYQQQKREKMLDELELLHKKKLLEELCIKPPFDNEQDSWWGASLISAISNNIQVIVENSHIMYECNSYTFGVKIHSLVIQTTNSNWQAGFMQPAEGVNIYKKIEITGFSIYWNPMESTQENENKLVATYDLLKKKLGSNFAQPNNSYILQPLSLEVKIEKNSSRFPLRVVPNIPRFKLDIRSRKIELEFNKQQMAQIRSLAHDCAQFERARPHRKWRPIVSVKESPKQWWKFFAGRIIEEGRCRRTYFLRKEILSRLKMVNAYGRAYLRRLELYLDVHSTNESSRSTISHDDIALLKQIEHDSEFTYNVLHTLREAVFQRVLTKLSSCGIRSSNNDSPFEVIQPGTSTETSKPEVSQNQASRQGWYGWMSDWFATGHMIGGNISNSEVDEAIYFNKQPPKLIKHQLDPELKEVEARIEAEILQVLNESWDDSTILRRDNLLAEIMLDFNKLFFRLYEDDCVDTHVKEAHGSESFQLLTFDLSHLCGLIRLSPKEHRTEMSLSIGDFSIQRVLHLHVTENESSSNPSHTPDGNVADDYDAESLICGFRNTDENNTRVLLTIGRRHCELSSFVEHDQHNESEAIFQLSYKRLAPKLETYHEFNISSVPLIIICDECALSGIFNTYLQNFQDPFDQNTERKESNDTTQHVFISLDVPELLIEMRGQKTAKDSLLNAYIDRVASNSANKTRVAEPDQLFEMASSPFARANIHSLLMTFTKREFQHRSKLKIDFESILLEDTLQNSEEFPLLKITDGNGPNYSEESKCSLSQSCPDLRYGDGSTGTSDSNMLTGSSLPNISFWTNEVKSAESLNNSKTVPNNGRRRSKQTTNNLKCRRHSLLFIFDESSSTTFGAQQNPNCQILGSFKDDEIEIGVNRRAWILLLDFFGMLNSPIDFAINSNYLICFELDAMKVRLGMNYPENGTQLGVCTLDHPKLIMKIDVNVPTEPIQLCLSSQGLNFTDSTQFCNYYYTDRLNIALALSLNEPIILINILKYRTSDLHCIQREFDVSIVVEIKANVNYLHTHRYFSAFLDFWLQLSELYDKVTINKLRRQSDDLLEPATNMKTRCKIDANIAGGGIFVFIPLHHHSDRAIVFESTSLHATNCFAYLSSLNHLSDKQLINQCQPNSAASDECLLDVNNLTLQNLRIRHGIFVPKSNEQQYKAMARQNCVTLFDAFDGIAFFSKADQIVMDKPNFALTLEIYRNLSAFAHNVPELFVLLRLQDVMLNFSTEFYKLLRGCLDYNFGEQLIPQPETIPVELLELPELNVEFEQKYSVFALRIILKKVQFLLKTPNSPVLPDVFDEFARLQIRSAKILYDSFVDAHSVFDFICENATLEDVRSSGEQKELNVFKKILQPKAIFSLSKRESAKSGSNSTNSSKEQHAIKRLLFETHIKMSRDEPPIISIILDRARIILLMDWIESLKAFVLLNAESGRNAPSNFGSGILIRSMVPPQPTRQHSLALSQPSCSLDSYQMGSKFTLKVTLKECDLIALEDPTRADTFALIAHTTAAISSNNLKRHALIETQYEIKQFNLHWCKMDSQADTLTQLTNETSATVSVFFESSLIHDDGFVPCNKKKLTLNRVEDVLSRHTQIVSVEFGTLVIRGSLKDFFIAKCISEKFTELWEAFQEQDIQFWSRPVCLTSTTNLLFQPESSSSCFSSKIASKLFLKCDNLCVWILEEGLKINTTPYLRFNISDLNVQGEFWNFQIRLNLGIDYYRLRIVPGWEPFLENHRCFFIDIGFTEPKQWTIRLKSESINTLELNFTQTFIERTSDFSSHCNSICNILLDSHSGIDKFRDTCPQQRKHSQLAETTDSVASDSTKSYTETPKLTDIVMRKLSHGKKIHLVDHKQLTNSSSLLLDIQLELDHGVGISLISGVEEDGGQEELCYGRLTGLKLNIQRKNKNWQICCHVKTIQIDSQLLGADRCHFLFCDPSACEDEPILRLPALSFEMSFTPTEFYDVYECFRLKLSNSCILIDEQLFWRLVQFFTNILNRSKNSSGSTSDGIELQTSIMDKNCFFGTFQIDLGNISLSVSTVDKNVLPPSIRQLKESYSDRIILFSFDNALVKPTPFCLLRCFCSVDRLIQSLADFYLNDLRRQKLNIILALDAFGNPNAFGSEIRESFQGLLFEGDLAGFAFGLGYGAANSLSKVTSSMAQGVGSLTFDESHENLRRRMRGSKPDQSGPLTHLYGGIKGLGVGVFGGLTAIAKNTIVATQEDGLVSGLARGITTGAIDTITKPLQGTLDLLEGTASAVKDIVGAPLARRAHFPPRLRLTRVSGSLSGLLQAYDAEMAEAQQELLRITGQSTLSDENRLLSMVAFLSRTNLDGSRITMRALISLTQCYIVRQVDEQSMVTYRILFQYLKTAQLANTADVPSSSSKNPTRLVPVEIIYHSSNVISKSTSSSQLQSSTQKPALTLWFSDRETAKRFCKQLNRAKALFERRGIGKVVQRNPKKLLPIFTI